VERLKEIAHYWRTRTRRFIEWRFWRMCLLNEKIVRKTFRTYFGDRAVNQTEIPYWANAVDIRTGKEYTIQDGSLVDCVRASIALPGLLPPSARDSHLLVDAGIMDPVPVMLVRKMGCHYAIGINAMAELEAQEISSRYPFNAFDIMTRCMFVMGHEIGQARAEQAANVVFTPSLGAITMLQFSRSHDIIECGRKAAEAQLPRILEGYERLKAGGASEAPKAAPPK
jgi:NTE family protein